MSLNVTNNSPSQDYSHLDDLKWLRHQVYVVPTKRTAFQKRNNWLTATVIVLFFSRRSDVVSYFNTTDFVTPVTLSL